MTPNLLDELEAVSWLCDAPDDGTRVAVIAKAVADMCERHGWKITPLYDAPALADMAKRLEAAERDAGKCWALHLKGPDDVVAAPSREAAEIVARNFNAYWDAHKHERDHDVRVVAEAIEWDHGAVDHARSVAEHWPEYTDLLDAAQEGEG